MSDDETLAARIDKLEMRVVHQDEIIEDLNETITAQWKQIDWLTRQLTNLVERMEEADGRSNSGAPPERPPPHY